MLVLGNRLNPLSTPFVMTSKRIKYVRMRGTLLGVAGRGDRSTSLGPRPHPLRGKKGLAHLARFLILGSACHVTVIYFHDRHSAREGLALSA